MLQLPAVTLVCADTANHALALRALAKSQENDTLRTRAVPDRCASRGSCGTGRRRVVRIDPLDSRDAYSQLMLKSLLPHIDTPHALVIQWDGYVVNARAWDPAFLDCDYIGAKWYWHGDGLRIGNGGFSLRSRRLLRALQDPRIELVDAEDATIGRTFPAAARARARYPFRRRGARRPLLVRGRVSRSASRSASTACSISAAPCAAEIAALAPDFSAAIARSPQLLQLLRNCIAMGQWDAARAIAQRVLAVTPDHADAARDARPGGRARRNRHRPVAMIPCPCGSGRKFKHCHGALGAGTATARLRCPTPMRSCAMRWRRISAAISTPRSAATAKRSARAPDHPMATHFLGVALYQRGRIDEALPLLRAAVAAVPGEAEFHNNLGLALAAADRTRGGNRRVPARARVATRTCDRLEQPRSRAAGRQSAGGSDRRLSPRARARRRISRRRTGISRSRLLAHQEFDEGWREYDWRHRDARIRASRAPMAGPRWDGTRSRRAARCSSPRSRDWATRCNSSVSRSRSPRAGRASREHARHRSSGCSRAHRASPPSIGPDDERCLRTTRMYR